MQKRSMHVVLAREQEWIQVDSLFPLQEKASSN